MIYSTLQSIPISKFIDVYCGNIQALVIKGTPKESELQEKAKELIQEYVQIVGGKGAAAAIFSRNDEINCQLRLDIMRNCEILMGRGQFEAVSEVLSQMGYKVSSDNKEAIKTKVKRIIAESKFKLARLKNKYNDQPEVKPSKELFYKEVYMLMAYLKMPFDVNQVSAHAYAHWVKTMNDEVMRNRISLMNNGRK